MPVESEMRASPEIRQAIGTIIIASSNLENLLEFFIWMMLATDKSRYEAGEVLTTKLTFTQKLEQFDRLCQSLANKNRELLAELGVIVEKVRDANSRRNDVVHSSYEYYDHDDEATIMVRRKAWPQFNKSEYKYGLGEFEDIIFALETARLGLFVIATKVGSMNGLIDPRPCLTGD